MASNLPAVQAESSPVQIVNHSPPSAPDPTSLISMAIERGADITTLERLMDLHDRMRKDQAARAFHDALAAAQGDFPPIPKTRNIERRSIKYASLDDLMGLITPVLQRHRLAVSFHREFHKSDDGKTIVAVSSSLIVRHGDGHSETFPAITIPVERATSSAGNAIMTAPQAVGCAMTYADRYAYQGGLGFRPCDEDTDGEAQTARSVPMPQPKTQAPAPADFSNHPKDDPPFDDEPKDDYKDIQEVIESEGKPNAPDFNKPGWRQVRVKACGEPKSGTNGKGVAWMMWTFKLSSDHWVSTYHKSIAEMMTKAQGHHYLLWLRIVKVNKGGKDYLNVEEAWKQ